MRYQVLLTEGAEHDPEELYDYIAAHDSPTAADHVLSRILEISDDLATAPNRGSHPKELLELGIRDFRQTFFKPYRLIYRVLDKRVVIYLIVDGRRDLQSVLTRRLLAG